MAARDQGGPTGTETWWVDRVPHPVLPLLVATDEEGSVVCVSLGAAIAPIWKHARRHGARLEADRRRTKAHRQLLEYLGGRRTEFDFPIRPLGTEFQQTVWAALTSIPFGSTRSYAQLAGMIDRPSAVRAVGHANGRNPLPIVVPCHRVVGHDGRLTGFGGGLPMKSWLLELESPQVGLGTWTPKRLRPTPRARP